MASDKEVALLEIAESLPEIMRRLFGRRLITSGVWELTILQLRTLGFVVDRPRCTMGELAQSLGIGLSEATGLTDRLVQHKLVEREADPGDRRRVRVRPTGAGRSAREACRRERRQRLHEALRLLSREEQTQVAAGLALLRKALEAVASRKREEGE
jgi:DNA-binding MarR family transcriptional regulator